MPLQKNSFPWVNLNYLESRSYRPIYVVKPVVYFSGILEADRRKIRLIENNAKCRHLKKLPVKGLCGRCLSVLGPLPSKVLQKIVSNTTQHPPPIRFQPHTVCTYCTSTQGKGDERWTREKVRGTIRSSQSWVENANMTDCISSL